MLSLILLLSAAAPAEQGPASRPRSPRPYVASRPASIASPAASRPSVVHHSRVRVTLKNGQKLTGIVKQNKLSERAEGFDFFPAAKSEPTAGLRLWFANPGQNYLFIPHRDIDAVLSMGLVSELEVREIEAKFEEDARRARERDGIERLAALRLRAERDDAERAAGEKSEQEKKKVDEEKAKADKLEKAKRLVDRYPPEQGWGAEKRDAILAKKANHLYPTPEELEFVKLFDAWKEAVDLLAKSEGAEGGSEGDEPEADDDN